MKKVLILASILLYSFGYVICDLLFDVNTPEGLNSAWELRMILISLYTILLLIANTASFKYYEVPQIGVLSVTGIGIVAEDIIEKSLGINAFNLFDILFIAFLLIGSILFYYPNLRTFLWQKLKN